MHHGRVVEQGLTDQLLEDPQHPYSQRLVAAARGRETRRRPTVEPILSVRGLHKSFTLHDIDGRDRRRRSTASTSTSAPASTSRWPAPAAPASRRCCKCVYRTYLPTRRRRPLRTTDGPRRRPDRAAATASWPTCAGARSATCRSSCGAEPRPRRARRRRPRRRPAGHGPRTTARDAARVALRRLNIDESLWDVYADACCPAARSSGSTWPPAPIAPPRLLLLDEPVSALDPANREAVLDLIADLTDHGVAVLAVFHDLDAMARLATRVVLLRGRSDRRQGPPETVLGRTDRRSPDDQPRDLRACATSRRRAARPRPRRRDDRGRGRTSSSSVEQGGAAPPGAIDGRGLFCLPGLVDTHSDGLEKELRPRPNGRPAARLRAALVRGPGAGGRGHDGVPRRRVRERREVPAHDRRWPTSCATRSSGARARPTR